jgi:hypothetical protein
MTRGPIAEKGNYVDRAPRTEGTGNLGEKAYQQIRTEILFYQLPPGSRHRSPSGSIFGKPPFVRRCSASCRNVWSKKRTNATYASLH